MDAFGTTFKDAYHVIQKIEWTKQDLKNWVTPPGPPPGPDDDRWEKTCNVYISSYANKKAKEDNTSEPICEYNFKWWRGQSPW